MTIFHPGDLVLVNTSRENYCEFNGNLATFLSYYPAVLSDKEVSNLHVCMISADWIATPRTNGPGIMSIYPEDLIIVNKNTIPTDIVSHQ